MTAEFNKNVLAVLNRRLGADFDLDAFEHVAFFDEENLFVDIRLRSLRRQMVTFRDLGMTVAFERGEEMRTEISTKFARAGLEGIYAEAGLVLTDWWTDPEGLVRPLAGARWLSRVASASISSPTRSGVVIGRTTGQRDAALRRTPRGAPGSPPAGRRGRSPRSAPRGPRPPRPDGPSPFHASTIGRSASPWPSQRKNAS